MAIEDDLNNLREFVNNVTTIDIEMVKKGFKTLFSTEIRSINNRRRFMDQITGMIIDDVEIEDYFNCLFSIDIDKDFERLLYLLDTKKTFYTKIKK
mgnify:CR=1 FL=1